MISFNWKNIELKCFHELEDRAGVAFSWTGTLIASDENGNTRERLLGGSLGTPGTGGLLDAGDDFIEADDITKEDVVSWIESKLLNLDEIKNELSEDLSTYKLIRFE